MGDGKEMKKIRERAVLREGDEKKKEREDEAALNEGKKRWRGEGVVMRVKRWH